MLQDKVKNNLTVNNLTERFVHWWRPLIENYYVLKNDSIEDWI